MSFVSNAALSRWIPRVFSLLLFLLLNGVTIGGASAQIDLVPPVVSAVRPALGPAGATITVQGLNFSSVTGVAVNGVPCGAKGTGFFIDSALKLRFVVPAGATSGKVSVTSAVGSGISLADFSVLQAPYIYGRVTNHLGSQVGGVTILRSGSATATAPVSTVSGPEGYYGFGGLTAAAAGTVYTLTPGKAGFAFNTPSSQVRVWPGSGVMRADFIAMQGLSIYGQVTDPAGNGIADVTMTLSNGSTVRTNANGCYGFANLLPLLGSNYTVTAAKSGLTLEPPVAAVTLTNASVPDVSFFGFQSSYLTGRIVNSAGAPVAGVSVLRSGSNAPSITDARGYYTFTDVPAGNVTLTPSRAGITFKPLNRLVIMPATGGKAEQDFTAFFSVSGRVTDSAGAGLNGATLTLSQGSRSYVATSGGTGAVAGNFTISGAPSGAYLLKATLAGHTFSPGEVPVILTNAGAVNQLFIGATGPSVSGRVLTAAGLPLAGVNMSYSGLAAPAQTNASGYYAFSQVPSGAGTVSASLDKYAFSPASRAVAITDSTSQSGLNFTALSRPSISGRVVDENGAPLEGVQVSLAGTARRATTDREGLYGLTAIAPSLLPYNVTPVKLSYSFEPVSTPASILTGDDAVTVNIVGKKILPSISALTTGQGAPGSRVGVLGSGFFGVTQVTINGVSTTFTVGSPTSLNAVVPVGAVAGRVKVTTITGTATSPTTFKVAPTITDFSPSNGPAGTPIQIKGAGFSLATSVTFTGVPSFFTVNSNGTVINATVPEGAGIGPLRVTTAGGTDAVFFQAAENGEGETLYNGIVLPSLWPPNIAKLPVDPQPVPYLLNPPDVIPIDVGRQLFVDDFLIQSTTLNRTYHNAQWYEGNPVLKADKPWEQQREGEPIAMPSSDGAWYDPQDNLFKMWYWSDWGLTGTGRIGRATSLAVSTDGINWTKPLNDVVEGTNIVQQSPRNSSTTWLDQEDPDPQRRYKMFHSFKTSDIEDESVFRVGMHTSADGVHWSPVQLGGYWGDRSTVFYNPFRKVWIASIRNRLGTGARIRLYHEGKQAQDAVSWEEGEEQLWVGADSEDLVSPTLNVPPQLYNLDGVGYESIMLGMFTMWHGQPEGLTKPNDLVVGYSRDGFHWSRPQREPFIKPTGVSGDWNRANVQSAGGVCLIVGDKLYFYVSGSEGIDGSVARGASQTGLATLRRDGFASLDAGASEGTVTTRPVIFNGRNLFVNANTANGQLRVEILDESGKAIRPFTKANCVPISTDSTLHRVEWNSGSNTDISALKGRAVRFRFSVTNGQLYSFWVSPDATGKSNGYVAAGGPGYTGPIDTMGSAVFAAAPLVTPAPTE